MPTRSSAPLGAPCWIDLTTSDVDRAQDFYGTVFGWAFESAGPDYGGYINAAKGGHPVAGGAGRREHPVWPIGRGSRPDGRCLQFVVSAGVMANRAAAWRAATRPCAVLVSQP